MDTEKGMIFKMSYLWILPFIVIMVVGAYGYTQMGFGGILISLVGLMGIGWLLVFSCLSVQVSRRGITGNYLLRSWDVEWTHISKWSVVNVQDNKKTIWFRTGARVYKISPDIFKGDEVEYLRAYFEKYCGKHLEKPAKFGVSWQ